MKTSLSAFDVFYLTKELQEIKEARIGKIYSDSTNISINMHNSRLGKFFIRFFDELMYITKSKTVFEDTPSNFAKLLRQNITNSIVRDVFQLESERIICFYLETKETRFNLYFELFGNGNVILTKDNKIIIAKTMRKYKDRSILPGKKYEYPKKNINSFKITAGELKDLFNNSTFDSAVRSLAIDLGIGGEFAKELLDRSKIDHTIPPKNINVVSIHSNIINLFNEEIKSNIIGKEIFFIDMKINESNKSKAKYYESFSLACDELFTKTYKTKTQVTAQTKYDKKILKFKSIIAQQEKQVKSLEKKISDNQRKGDIIYENYSLVEEELISSKERFKVIDL